MFTTVWMIEGVPEDILEGLNDVSLVGTSEGFMDGFFVGVLDDTCVGCVVGSVVDSSKV